MQSFASATLLIRSQSFPPSEIKSLYGSMRRSAVASLSNDRFVMFFPPAFAEVLRRCKTSQARSSTTCGDCFKSRLLRCVLAVYFLPHFLSRIQISLHPQNLCFARHVARCFWQTAESPAGCAPRSRACERPERPPMECPALPESPGDQA